MSWRIEMLQYLNHGIAEAQPLSSTYRRKPVENHCVAFPENKKSEISFCVSNEYIWLVICAFSEMNPEMVNITRAAHLIVFGDALGMACYPSRYHTDGTGTRVYPHISPGGGHGERSLVGISAVGVIAGAKPQIDVPSSDGRSLQGILNNSFAPLLHPPPHRFLLPDKSSIYLWPSSDNNHLSSIYKLRIIDRNNQYLWT
jgi:hypothetical protein